MTATQNKDLPVLCKIWMNRERSSHYFTEVQPCMSMLKQHAIADYSTSQLVLCCMMVWETLLQRKRKTVRFTKVELLLILRAYRAHPTRWIDVLNDVKANNPVSFTGQEHFVSWKSNVSQVREADVCWCHWWRRDQVKHKVTTKKTRCNCGRPVRPGGWATKTE